MVNRGTFLIALLLATSLAAGCSIGPQVIRGSRTRYNAAVQMTASEEMLLNLVRARYGDPPEFLAVSGITTQFEVGSKIGFGDEFGLGDPRVAGSLTTADRPTISMTPLQDEQFTRRFLSPIQLDTIYLFSRNGRKVERVLRLVVENVNGLQNGPVTTDASPGAFVWMARTLDDLAKRQQVELGHREATEEVSPPLKPDAVAGADVVAAMEKGYRFRAAEDESVVLTGRTRELMLRISPQAQGSPEIEGLTGLLQLTPGRMSYALKQATEGQLTAVGPREELRVSTRSVEEILHFLCQQVVVPCCHIERGLIAAHEGSPDGSLSAAADLLTIHSSKSRPRHAVVAVHHRDHWFFIDDADASSKETFELLLELYNLEIRGGGAASIPFLTLPVGR